MFCRARTSVSPSTRSRSGSKPASHATASKYWSKTTLGRKATSWGPTSACRQRCCKCVRNCGGFCPAIVRPQYFLSAIADAECAPSLQSCRSDMSTTISLTRFLLLAAAVLAAAGGSSRAASPAPLQGVHAGDLHRQVQACSDFYEFANGAWRAENPIPASLPRWSRRVAAHEANWRRQQSVLDEVSRRHDWPKGSVEQIVGDHYGSCMNEAAVDAAGSRPLAALLFEIDAIRNTAAVQRIIRRL